MKFANSLRYQGGGGYASLWQDHGKLVTTVARRGIDGPAAVPQDLSESAEGAVSDQMTELIVDLFQFVEIQQQQREFAAGPLGPADPRMQGLGEAAMIG
jgi:hypothetical protein